MYHLLHYPQHLVFHSHPDLQLGQEFPLALQILQDTGYLICSLKSSLANRTQVVLTAGSGFDLLPLEFEAWLISITLLETAGIG